MPRAPRVPEDPVTLRDGAALVGKSTDTLRRWRREGKLEFRYVGNKKTALISRAQLLLVAAAQVEEDPSRADAPHEELHTELPVDPLVEELRASVRRLEAQIEDTCQQRDHFRAETLELRAQLLDRDRRIVALEGQLHGGIRGLLRGAVTGARGSFRRSAPQ
jgi:hypothetical protein